MRIGMVAQSMSRVAGGVGEAMRMHAEAVRAVDHCRMIEIFAAADSHSAEDMPLYGATPVHIAPTIGPTRFRYAPKLAEKMVAANLDIVHVHGIWSPIALSVLDWHRRTGRPFVVAPHGMLEDYILARSRPAKKAASLLFQDRMMLRAAAIHALTEVERKQSRDRYPRQANIAVIPNYVHPPPSGDRTRPSWWHEDYSERTVFLYLGRLHEKKGVRELLRAWDRLSAIEPLFRSSAALVFCGWADGLKDFEAEVAALAALHGNLQFAGPQFGVDKWRSISSASYMVLPSKSEGLPMAALEAWSMGVPTIMSRECNLPEGFTAGAALQCAIDETGIASALRVGLALQPAERSRMRAAARTLVVDRFSRYSVGRQLCALFDRACGR